MSLLTAEKVTNLFLYGKETVPDNLVDGTLIRPKDLQNKVRTTVDMNEYMTTGPGRFASPASFEVIKQFFSSLLAPGVYTKQELFDKFGLDTIELRSVSIHQALYDDGKDDYVERAYIWATTAFQIHEDARFVVEATGNRYISNFGIVPYSNNNNTESFDFMGSRLSNLANSFLEPRIDPSKIGREVIISFGNPRTLAAQFTYQDYVDSASTAVQADVGLLATLAANGVAFTDRLFQSGSTRFLYGDQPIAYGTTGGESLDAMDKINLSAAPKLNDYYTNGVVLVAGGGDDQVGGSVYDDILYGDTGNDILRGGKGVDDYIYAIGDGQDTIIDSASGGAPGDGKGRVMVVDAPGKLPSAANALTGATAEGSFTADRHTQWDSDDGKTHYQFVVGSLDSASGGTLEITGANLGVGGKIIIKNFKNDNLGIHLNPERASSPPPPKPDKISKTVSDRLIDAQNPATYRQDPLTLDLDGDGLETVPINAAAPILFDLGAQGVKTSVGWVSPDDGFLVMDRNGNGTIDSGAELFGDATPLDAGGRAVNGFAALADLDGNLDGKVDVMDAKFANLRVWKDANQDGISQSQTT